MSNSNSVKQSNYPIPTKITNRNPVFRSTTNLGQSSITSKPFSRKPSNQVEPLSLQSSKINERQLQISVLEKSCLDTQSVVSGERSVRQSKFIRTNKMNFRSPKSRNKERDQSFSPQHNYGTQSMILKGQPTVNKKFLNDSVKEKEQALSQSSIEQNENYLQKSISSNNLFRRSNKTRNMILSKFAQYSRQSKQKQSQKDCRKQLETSIHNECRQNERKQRKKIQKLNVQLKQRNSQKQKQCEDLTAQNTQLCKQNQQLETQIAELKKRIQQLLKSKPAIALEEKTSSQNNLQSINGKNRPPYQASSQANSNGLLNQNKKCLKCEEKEKSNQKQVTYFENVIKKKENELVALRRVQTALTKQNTENAQALSQTKKKLTQLQEMQKISAQNERKLQQFVSILKQQVAKLKDELRYLKIQNSVLLKIKNQNLKLKIDITKIEDERDYFKMKVIQIHKKHGTSQSSKNITQKFVRQNDTKRKSLNLQNSKKFYLDSTETEEIDAQRFEFGKKLKTKNFNTAKEKYKAPQSSRYSEQEKNFCSPYADTLFDLTSEQSQNSY